MISIGKSKILSQNFHYPMILVLFYFQVICSMKKEDTAIWEISIYILWSRAELSLLLTQMLKTQIHSLAPSQHSTVSKADVASGLLLSLAVTLAKQFFSKVGKKHSPVLQPCRKVIYSDRRINLSVEITLFEETLSVIDQITVYWHNTHLQSALCGSSCGYNHGTQLRCISGNESSSAEAI